MARVRELYRARTTLHARHARGTRLVVATPTRSAPPISIFTQGKRPVSRVSAQYTENRGERPWALTRETTVSVEYFCMRYHAWVTLHSNLKNSTFTLV